MTPQGFPVPDGFTWHELPTDAQPLVFLGRHLETEDTDDGDRPRWTELRLYRVIDTHPEHDDSLPPGNENRGMYGKQMWLLYTIAHSLIYHAVDGCAKGVATLISDFPAKAEDLGGLEPCPQCLPPDWESLPGDARLRLEMPWYPYTICQSPEKVIRALQREARCEDCQETCRRKPHRGVCSCGCRSYREEPRTLSGPGHNLIEKVRRIDPDIDAAAGQKVRI
jgi:hypothetical protein